MTQLRTLLVKHPLLVIELGFHLALDPTQPYGFVAQRKGIRYIYHTLINDKQLSDKVERETTISALRGTQASKQVRNDRLFLREYEGNGPYTKFVLFRVPVLPGNNLSTSAK